jgi:hypothetical protein
MVITEKMVNTFDETKVKFKQTKHKMDYTKLQAVYRLNYANRKLLIKLQMSQMRMEHRLNIIEQKNIQLLSFFRQLIDLGTKRDNHGLTRNLEPLYDQMKELITGYKDELNKIEVTEIKRINKEYTEFEKEFGSMDFSIGIDNEDEVKEE